VALRLSVHIAVRRTNMTEYATHRFSVGQQVKRSGDALGSFDVVALVAGAQGPEYKLKSGNTESVVGERELTYATAATKGANSRPQLSRKPREKI
jgi:hypothetical protein